MLNWTVLQGFTSKTCREMSKNPKIWTLLPGWVDSCWLVASQPSTWSLSLSSLEADLEPSSLWDVDWVDNLSLLLSVQVSPLWPNVEIKWQLTKVLERRAGSIWLSTVSVVSCHGATNGFPRTVCKASISRTFRRIVLRGGNVPIEIQVISATSMSLYDVIPGCWDCKGCQHH